MRQREKYAPQELMRKACVQCPSVARFRAHKNPTGTRRLPRTSVSRRPKAFIAAASNKCVSLIASIRHLFNSTAPAFGDLQMRCHSALNALGAPYILCMCDCTAPAKPVKAMHCTRGSNTLKQPTWTAQRRATSKHKLHQQFLGGMCEAGHRFPQALLGRGLVSLSNWSIDKSYRSTEYAAYVM